MVQNWRKSVRGILSRFYKS